MLYVEPMAGPAPIVQVIREARNTVDLNVYYLADRRILDALHSAVRRGVRVRVILEGRPYGMHPWKIRKEFRAVQETGAMVQPAPARFESTGQHYAFDHAKYVCNGHECEIGTANFSWSAFHRNREYLCTTWNPQTVWAARTVFSADWKHVSAPEAAHRILVLSPRTSAEPLLRVLEQPGPVDVESEELGPYRPILEAMAAKGRDLRMILPSSLRGRDRHDAAFLRREGVRVRFLRSPYMHAKMVTGNRLGFVGSENFTETSLNKNREMGLLLGGPDLRRLRAQFRADWELAKKSGSGDWKNRLVHFLGR